MSRNGYKKTFEIPLRSIRASIQGGIRDIQLHLKYQSQGNDALQQLLMNLEPYFERAKFISTFVEEIIRHDNPVEK